MAKGVSIGSIQGEVQLNSEEFKTALAKTQGEMARVMAEMQKNSKVKLSLDQYQQFSKQLNDLKGNAQELRLALIAAPAGSEQAKQLRAQLGEVGKEMKVLRDVIEPARKEMEKLGATTSEVMKSGAEKAQAFGKSLSLYVTTALVAVGAAIFKAAEDTGALAESILNLSQKTGMSTDYLQKLKVVAENAGLTFDSITTAITGVQRKLMGMEEGSGPAAEAMKRLGISVTNSHGGLRSMGEIIPAVISKLQAMANVTERNMLAAQIFGKGFGEIAPLLAMTSKEFDAAGEHAKELGLVLGGDALKKAAAFDDQLDELKQRFAGITREVGAAVIPVLEDTLGACLSNTKVTYAKPIRTV